MPRNSPFDDQPSADLLATSEAGDNSAPISVSELSQALKRTVEDRFGYVRLRGELSGVKRAASGHMYLALKDDKAVLDGVMWKSAVPRLSFHPEDGIEVVASGKLTTYPGRSKYQIVIERMEIAGEGALLALLEKTRKRLEAEGLFATERKRPLPFAPRVIGVVTSPTGAVIRDILHRLEDRFPTHVVVWPVVVQGDGAAKQVADAVHGFGTLPGGGKVPRPDLLIVARGGGSIEDLWSFNEEIVVRAVAESPIPVISAVGHETDTTLCDHAADRRAPTPTAAAEIAVPVLREIAAMLEEMRLRQRRCADRPVQLGRERLGARVSRLPRPEALLQAQAQRLDEAGERLRRALLDRAARGRHALADLRLSPAMLRDRAETARTRLSAATPRPAAMQDRLSRSEERLAAVRFAPYLATAPVVRARDRLAATRLTPALVTRPLAERGQRLAALERLRVQLDPKAPLQRGYALVCAPGHPVISSRDVAERQDVLTLEFADGTLQAVPAASAPRRRASVKRAAAKPADGQPKLL
ncbi:exodeoxyribonuclease VII large subunit [Aurantiacibacter spongiae]|uniref:Exodeoxyribonuclease 7 large subunit n=1 Tax=Aurantiacibacter spongiae TaxID=2488860 RepID=A0A3N5CT86_9SPHN|nr:exodeoxyribonuclease VII large subunit [Aurantiacibacter spongiae]RPF71506.1 exodeoxyribonuclease VII large subunit [Aurantiacibacter spongiae]